jgi:Squalene-hopene cyclase C-terminal domain/Prenyltransferase and squalene oxidase repeat
MKLLLLAIAAVAIALPILGASAALPESAAVGRAASFIVASQEADGGFGGFGDGQTFDAVYALRSAGIDPAVVKRDGKSPADFLRAKAGAQVSAAAAAKAALAAKALGLDPSSVNGIDLQRAVSSRYNDINGRFAGDDFSQSIAILGLVCTGGSAPGGSLSALKSAQLADGGWGFDGFSDADTTAIAVQALFAAGVPKSDAAVGKGLAYFKATQAADGGWGFDPTASNASSTAFVVQALIAAGEDADGAAYRKGDATPVSFILAQQLPDGSFAGFDPGFAANQVTPALAGRTFCDAVSTPVTRAVPTPTPTATATVTTTATASPAATATPTASPAASPAATVSATAAVTPVAPKAGSGASVPAAGALPFLAALLSVGATAALLTLSTRKRS